MKRHFTRKRLALSLSVLGVALMGVDLLITRNVFVHIGELMAASILCLAAALALDHSSGERKQR